MKGILQVIVGLSALFLIGYTLIVSILILTGNTDKTFADISIQLVISCILVITLVLGFLGDRKRPKSSQRSENPTASDGSDQPKPVVHPEGHLHNGIYEQSSRTWWYDSDGDQHEGETEYADLRFYEDGTVIGIRKQAIPKKENPDSFVYQGRYSQNENRIDFTLKKVVDTDDRVVHHISSEEQRNMKYAGHIVSDDDLIQAGTYSGVIAENSLQIGEFEFRRITPDRLIVTASEEACDLLKNQFQDHPLVLGCFMNSGNWYSNGETGPEWYTVTFESRYELRQKLEEDIRSATLDIHNMFWG